jgi:hypothetical protein
VNQGSHNENRPLALAAIAVAGVSFLGLTWRAWNGTLGLPAIALLIVAAVAFFFGRKRLSPAARAPLDTVAKALFTIVGMMPLLRHPIDAGEGVRLPIYEAIARYIGKVDGRTFLLFAVVAMAV